MPLHAVAYSSVARPDLVDAALDRIVADATAFNRVAGVSGALMFDGTRFVQYIEGPRDGLDSVFQRIVNARAHMNLHVLARMPLKARWFPRWSMTSRLSEPEVLDGILLARWAGFDPLHSEGFSGLLQVWTGRQGEIEPAAVMLGS